MSTRTFVVYRPEIILVPIQVEAANSFAAYNAVIDDEGQALGQTIYHSTCEPYEESWRIIDMTANPNTLLPTSVHDLIDFPHSTVVDGTNYIDYAY